MSRLPEGALARFQDAFARVLAAPPDAEPEREIAALAAQPGFAVYRNTVAKGLIDALRANYPAVQRLVGEEWFAAAAAAYARTRRPAAPMLFKYGGDFAQFLAGFPPAAALPYLAAVAKLDRCWSEAHAARDEPPLVPARIAALEPAALAGCVLRPHPSARWAFFDDFPAVTVWRRNREETAPDLSDLVFRAEGVLIVRPHAEVVNVDLDAAGCAFLDACRAGEPLHAAAQCSLALDPGCDLERLMARLLEAGAFAAPPHTAPHLTPEEDKS